MARPAETALGLLVQVRLAGNLYQTIYLWETGSALEGNLIGPSALFKKICQSQTHPEIFFHHRSIHPDFRTRIKE